MVVRIRVGDSETDRHRLEEGGIRKDHTPGAEIGRHLEDQLETAGPDRPGTEERCIESTLGVGRGPTEQGSPAVRFEREEGQGETGRRPSGHGVEHVGGEPSASALRPVRHPLPFRLSSRRRANPVPPRRTRA